MTDSKSQSAGGAGGTAALEARIERIRQTITAHQARLARGSMITAAIGAMLCVLMAVYFYIGYSRIKDVLTPKELVMAAEAYILDQLPEARRALETHINDSADEWAAQLSSHLQENVPVVRNRLEELIVGKADEAMDNLQVLSADQFRQFVIENRNTLADGFNSLKRPEEAERFVHDLQGLLEQQLSGDVREQAEEMLHTAIDLNAKLQVLAEGAKLNQEQALEREILMIARRLQTESQADLPERPPQSSKVRTVEAQPEDAPIVTPTGETGTVAETPKDEGAGNR